MRALVRLAGIGVVGVVLYFVGQAHGIVQVDPRPHRAAALAVVALLAVALVLLVWLTSGTGDGDARVPGARLQRHFAIAWRHRRTSPEVGIVLAYLPLFFAWRSLFSYFYLLPLFAAAAVARMPLGALEREVAQRLGAVSLADLGPRESITRERAAVPAAPAAARGAPPR